MTKRLIVNADDFGLTVGVNRSVHELSKAGALTSTTLMANGDAFDQAVAIASATPELGVGCHVVLTDGVPLCTPKQIPTLIGNDGKSFRGSLRDFWSSVLLGKVSESDIEREAIAQIRKLQTSGLAVTHVDTHKHTHILPRVAAPLLRAAEQLGIQAVRNPFEQPWSLEVCHGNFKRELQVRLMSLFRRKFEGLPQIRDGSVVTTNGTIGISATGRLDSEVLESLLSHLPEGTWELVCHPGYNDSELQKITTRLRGSREVEHTALLDAFTQTSSQPFAFELIHYGMLRTAEADMRDSRPTTSAPEARVGS